ncbi:hypothetical protein D9M70_504030 [compost metagenome]
MVEHHRGVAAGAGQGDLCPRLAFASRLFGAGKRRHLHEGMLGMEQPETLAPALQVGLDFRQRQALAVPAQPVLLAPAAEGGGQRTVGNGEQQPILRHQGGRRGIGQGHDLAASREDLQQAQLHHPAVCQAYG